MATIDKKEIAACCGKKQIIWTLSVPLAKEHLTFLKQAGFPFVKTYFDAGMLYIEDSNLVATGVFGLRELKIKCKNRQCPESTVALEKTFLDNLT